MIFMWSYYDYNFFHLCQGTKMSIHNFYSYLVDIFVLNEPKNKISNNKKIKCYIWLYSLLSQPFISQWINTLIKYIDDHLIKIMSFIMLKVIFASILLKLKFDKIMQFFMLLYARNEISYDLSHDFLIKAGYLKSDTYICSFQKKLVPYRLT